MKIINCDQGTPAWQAARVGIPTASCFSRLVTNTLVDGEYKLSTSLPGYAAELAAELFAGKTMNEFDGNAWMNRGKETEEEAAELYAFTTDRELIKVGFITNDEGTFGCSPDRLVAEDGGLEIKCLKAENHVALMQYHEKHGRAEPKYTQQVQGCLWITGRAWWDQFYFHPDLPPLTVRQVPNQLMHKALERAITEVITARDLRLEMLRKQNSSAA